MKTKKCIFKGVATAMITPFLQGKIDYATLDRLIEMQIEAGISALVIGGTTGEAATLTDGERYSLFEFCKEKIDGRTKLILGTGTNDTRLALEHTRRACEIGCDGVLVVTPYYNKGTEEGVFRHYMTLLDSVDLPMILYNVPTRTGVNLGLGLLRRIAEHENAVGIKEAADSADRLVALSSFGEELPLYAGNDSQIYTSLALGGMGVISVISNLLPKESLEIFKQFCMGNLAASLKLQKRLIPLINALFVETNPAPIKWAMSLSGLCSPQLRLPLYEVRESTKKLIEKELLELKNY